MSDELQRRLEALGAAEAPPLEGARLDAVTARVAATTATSDPFADRRRRVVLGVAAGLVALLVAGIVIAAALGSSDEGLRLELADGVTLDLPDADPTEGSIGDDLPDGTTLTVRDGGEAVVDGRRLGPGSYLVVDGRIVELGGDASTTTTTTTTSTARTTIADRPDAVTTTRPAGATTTTVAPPDDRPPVDGTRPGRPTTTRPVDRTTVPDRTTTTVRDGPTTTVRDRPTTTVRPTTTTTPSATTTVRDRATTTTSTVTTTTTTIGDRPPGDRP